MLSFQKGDSGHPGGNLLVYSHVRGENPVAPGARLLSCNVVVSFLSVQANHFPVVIFPPVGLESEDELDRLIALNPRYDVVQLEDFEVPAGADEGAYVKERLEELNACVMEYVELCRDFIARLERNAATPPRIVRRADESGGPQAADQPVDEEQALERLEACLDRAPVEESSKPELEQLIRFIESRYPQYDVRNLWGAFGRGAADLSRLYLQKFRAIHAERYEEAAAIQDAILRLERMS